MTSFRRFVILIAEVMQILSMLVGTLYGGVIGAASGSMFGPATGVRIERLGEVASVGGVVGFCIGALGGFVLSATFAAILFALSQIERNTRILLANEVAQPVSVEQMRRAPHF
jgi:hypothetical protein